MYSLLIMHCSLFAPTSAHIDCVSVSEDSSFVAAVVRFIVSISYTFCFTLR